MCKIAVAPLRERGLKFDKLLPLFALLNVAPLRERGLKYTWCTIFPPLIRRSFAGAWIEIIVRRGIRYNADVAPLRERGLKSDRYFHSVLSYMVAPLRERGLKLQSVIL